MCRRTNHANKLPLSTTQQPNVQPRCHHGQNYRNSHFFSTTSRNTGPECTLDRNKSSHPVPSSPEGYNICSSHKNRPWDHHGVSQLVIGIGDSFKMAAPPKPLKIFPCAIHCRRHPLASIHSVSCHFLSMIPKFQLLSLRYTHNYENRSCISSLKKVKLFSSHDPQIAAARISGLGD